MEKPIKITNKKHEKGFNVGKSITATKGETNQNISCLPSSSHQLDRRRFLKLGLAVGQTRDL